MDDVLTMHVLHKPEFTAEDASCGALRLAEAYVRPQPLEGFFSPEEGLAKGTVFPNLYKPYMGRVAFCCE
jgi:hypothetical protein